MASPLYLDLSFLPPGRMGAPRFIGAAVEAGSSVSGISLASNATAGGFVCVDYYDIQLGGATRDQTLYFNRLMNTLSGGIRTCVVPFLVDVFSPFKDSSVFSLDIAAGDALTPFSDTSTFDDGSMFSQPPVAGIIVTDAGAGAATVTLTVVNGRELQGGEWFGVQHLIEGFRAYSVTDIDDQTVDSNGNVTATVAIRAPLRGPITAGMVVDWWRPRCLMRIKPGADPILDLSDNWVAKPSISFVEAF